MAKNPLFKPSRVVSLPRKERLFEDFFVSMIHTTERIENLFDLSGIKEQVFGYDHSRFDSDSTQAKEKLRTNRAWLLVSELYDYAVDGIDRTGLPGAITDATSSLVIDAGEVIAMLTGEENQPSIDWRDIVKMGDGRVALEDGMGLDVERLALLANVDVRTVRNAVSSGALLTSKHEDPCISNDSARLWLMGRKGFKPTVTAGAERINLSEVHSTDRFGAFLKQRRAERKQGLATDDAPIPEPMLDVYPGLTREILAEVEAGVFRIPLSLAWPLADFYCIAREEFLSCVMRVFFPEELEVLSASLQRGRLNLVATSEAGKSHGSV